MGERGALEERRAMPPREDLVEIVGLHTEGLEYARLQVIHFDHRRDDVHAPFVPGTTWGYELFELEEMVRI